MATLRDRFNALFRYRVGKFDSQTLAADLGIYGTTVSGANIMKIRRSRFRPFTPVFTKLPVRSPA